MPRTPFLAHQRRLNTTGSSLYSHWTRPHSPHPSSAPIMNPLALPYPMQTQHVTIGDNTLYTTPTPHPNQILHSRLEMSMLGQTLSFSIEMEGREILIIVQNPTFLTQVVSEGMRIAMDTYNHHLWLLNALQLPLTLPFPQLPFYNMPTWELPLFNPFINPPLNLEISMTPSFLFPHKVPMEDPQPWTVPEFQVFVAPHPNLDQENLGASPS